MKNKKNIFAGIIGNVLEYYNLTLYGFLTFHLTPLFFPDTEDIQLEKLLSLSAFAISFLARPFGALILGALGDTLGRKKALGLAILIAAFPSFIIGILPSYNIIGMWAPFLLIVSRITQGISIGGEYGNAVAFILEEVPIKKENLMGSLLCASGFVGGIFAAIFASFFTLDFFPDYFWRIPFLIGGGFALFGYYLRKKIQDENSFYPSSKGSLIAPIKQIFTSEKMPLLRAMGVGIASSAPFYVASIYLNGIYAHQLKMGTSQLMFINVCYLILWVSLLPLFGYLADKITGQRLMKISAILISISGPLSFFLLQKISLASLISTQILITLCSVGFLASSNTYLKNSFSEKTRSSGISLGYTIGGVIMGGTSPLIVEFVSQYTAFPITLYLIVVGFIGTITILKYKNNRVIKIN